MFVTKKHLPRRTFLRGMGVSLALPLLDSMIPARTLLAQTAARPVTRLGFVYFPHGAIMNSWTPATEGAGFEFSPILKPLEPYRDQLNVITGLGHAAADTTAVHSLSPTTWLSGVRPKATQGVDAYAGVTADQIAARAIGQGTMLPSLELASEDPSALFGSCDVDYGCIYLNTLSWATPETPLPMETNPRKVFERLFGQGGSPAERQTRLRKDRSLLDAVRRDAASLQLQLGPADRRVMSQYLDNVREIERRIQLAGSSQSERELELPTRPAGVPFDYEEHVKLMYDLMLLAYQADVTRVISFMVSREVTARTYPQVGVFEGHHSVSHHANRAEKLEQNRRIQTYNVGAFTHLLERMRTTPDGDGSLLDHSLLLYGSNMSNSNAHDHFPLPNVVLGGASGRMRGGRHLRYPDRTPMTNLLLSMLDKTGVDLERLGDSTEPLKDLLGMRNALLTAAVLATLAADAAAQTQDLRLVQAAGAAERAQAIALLDGKADPSQKSADGTTALHWAARNNDVVLVDRLLRAGARPHPENRYGATPIALACESGSAAVVERLLKAGVSADATGPHGETALHTCAYAGSTAAARVLIAAGASINPGDSWRGQTPLMWAAAEGHPETMRVLIEAGADVDARSAIVEWERQRTDEPRDKWLPPGGWTPLLLSARENCIKCVDVLATAGADLNVVDPELHTALVLALINGHFDVAGRLIDLGADLNLQDKVGQTALWAAVDAHTMPDSNRPPPTEMDDTLTAWDIVAKLVKAAAAVDVPLRQRVPYRTKIDRGADGVLGAGTTPLLRAAKTGDAKVVALLLEHGANPRATVGRGVTSILLAANVGTSESDRTGRRKTEAGAIETIRLLMKAGADINAADGQGRTAAHGAALWGLTEVIRFLHANGVDLNRQDSRGLTPLETALGQGGGFGFGGRAGVVREETARVIAELTGVSLSDARARAATAAPTPQGGRTQEPDPDN